MTTNLYDVLKKSVSGMIAVSVMLLMAACKPVETFDLIVEASVSSDGQWIAVLTGRGSEKSKVKVMNMSERKWIDIHAPARTSSIRFGLKSTDLLLTHYYSNETSEAELGLISLVDGQYKRSTLFKGFGLDFPLEIESGQYLVRGCYPMSTLSCHRVVAVNWLLIKNQKVEVEYSANIALNYSQPNYIRGVGFYWNIYKTKEEEPPESFGFKLDGTEIDGKTLPAVDIKHGSPSCDYKNIRCINTFVRDTAETPWFYGIYIKKGNEHCKVQDLYGFVDYMSISPNGMYGISSLANNYKSKRRVVYMVFPDENCLPKRVEQIEIN